MSRFTDDIGGQFGNPHGIVGDLCCIIMNTVNRKMYRHTVRTLQIGADDRILDIGYGNGYLLSMLDRRTSPTLYGIDISADMKRSAEARNQRALTEGRLKLTVGDCCQLPYEDGMFSAVTSVNTVYFWSDLSTGLREIRRTLADGGSFYNAVYTREWLDTLSYTKHGFHKYAREELTEAGVAVGFRSVTVEEISHGKSYLVIYHK